MRTDPVEEAGTYDVRLAADGEKLASRINEFMEVECVVTHRARMRDPGGACVGVNTTCHFAC